MDRKVKQIITAAVVLASVTALSFGIKQIRIRVHRARIAAKAQETVSNGAGSEQYSTNEPAVVGKNVQSLDVRLEQDQQSAENMAESQEALAEADDEEGSEQSDGQENRDRPADAVSKGKSSKAGYAKSKGDYAKYEGSKGLQKISVSEHENIYITDKGERWYVAEKPDGTITKTQMQEVDGELQPVGETNVYRSDGGKGKSEGSQGK